MGFIEGARLMRDFNKLRAEWHEIQNALNKPREIKIEDYLVKQINLRGGRAIKLPTPSGYAGVPDRLCVMPGGVVFFVEVKSSTGRLNNAQYLWGTWLNDNEHLFYVVKSMSEVDALLIHFPER